MVNISCHCVPSNTIPWLDEERRDGKERRRRVGELAPHSTNTAKIQTTSRITAQGRHLSTVNCYTWVGVEPWQFISQTILHCGLRLVNFYVGAHKVLRRVTDILTSKRYTLPKTAISGKQSTECVKGIDTLCGWFPNTLHLTVWPAVNCHWQFRRSTALEPPYTGFLVQNCVSIKWPCYLVRFTVSVLQL